MPSRFAKRFRGSARTGCSEGHTRRTTARSLRPKGSPRWSGPRVRAPSLADLRIARNVVANVDLGGDGHPYVGLVENGLWMIAGFGGHGVMHAPPVAKLLAQTIAGRPDSTLDISSLSPWRSAEAAAEWMVASKKS